MLATYDDGVLQASRYETGYGFMDNWGARFYYHRDHLGNVRAVSNASGNSVRWTDYFAYGAIRDEWNIGQVRDNYRYNSKELDTETGLLYYGARYFEPMIGNWTTTDPMHEYPSAYIYVGNRPMISIDPDGRSTFTDRSGKVTGVTKDGSNVIWMVEEEILEDGSTKTTLTNKGNSLKWNSFAGSFDEKKDMYSGRGTIHFGSTWARDKITGVLNEVGGNFMSYAINAFGGGKYDIKVSGELKDNNGNVDNYYGSQLWEGTYVSAREAGNILAGMAAAQGGLDYTTAMTGFGSLQIGQEIARKSGLEKNEIFGIPHAGVIGARVFMEHQFVRGGTSHLAYFGEEQESHDMQSFGYKNYRKILRNMQIGR